MKIANLDSTIDITDLENFFEIYEDSQKNYRYNLNETIYINIDKSDCEEYRLTTEAFWPLISYKIYQTTRLAWLLMKINNVEGNQIFDKKKPGDIIYYLPKETVEQIIETL
jgi:hypothetical protein